MLEEKILKFTAQINNKIDDFITVTVNRELADCGNVLMHKWLKYPNELCPKSDGLPYCLSCGQKLDWSDEKREVNNG